MGLRVRVGPMVSCDYVVGGANERERLAATGALAVDMESAAIARAVAGVPTAVVRVIVDTAYSPVARLATVPAGVRALSVLRRTGAGAAQMGRR